MLSLTFGAIRVSAAAFISAPWNYTLIRFFIGAAGATFVTNQFWCSLMLPQHCVNSECHYCRPGQLGWRCNP
eukprot:9513195-Karenia_brevis.AAC.1